MITVLRRTRGSERGHGLNIIIRNASDLSIYEQIQQQLKAAILSGELTAGELLPSHPPVGQGAAHQRHHHQASL